MRFVLLEVPLVLSSAEVLPSRFLSSGVAVGRGLKGGGSSYSSSSSSSRGSSSSGSSYRSSPSSSSYGSSSSSSSYGSSSNGGGGAGGDGSGSGGGGCAGDWVWEPDAAPEEQEERRAEARGVSYSDEYERPSTFTSTAPPPGGRYVCHDSTPWWVILLWIAAVVGVVASALHKFYKAWVWCRKLRSGSTPASARGDAWYYKLCPSLFQRRRNLAAQRALRQRMEEMGSQLKPSENHEGRSREGEPADPEVTSRSGSVHGTRWRGKFESIHTHVHTHHGENAYQVNCSCCLCT